MRAQDKEVDGRELEREQRLAESELDKRDDDELPEVHAEQQRDLARGERAGLLAAMRAILDGEHVIVATLHLPAHELRALEALQEAVEGRDTQLDMFVYATDRRGLLEQALAILQPNLAYDDETYVELVARVGELRRTLVHLEEAQDELEDRHPVAKAKQPDAKPPTEVDPDAPEPASTLSVGPEVKDAPKPASTLAGGPDVQEEAKPATSLGDEKEIAAAQADEVPKKKSWWKRMLS
ncbi:MAG TPA: hypothetical protein VMJ10_26820 [Kofleriaceae bacterium]|nr:hypothetical protein [Kofleriaceae bacterium]